VATRLQLPLGCSAHLVQVARLQRNSPSRTKKKPVERFSGEVLQSWESWTMLLNGHGVMNTHLTWLCLLFSRSQQRYVSGMYAQQTRALHQCLSMVKVEDLSIAGGWLKRSRHARILWLRCSFQTVNSCLRTHQLVPHLRSWWRETSFHYMQWSVQIPNQCMARTFGGTVAARC
jgi:hypothetical protein